MGAVSLRNIAFEQKGGVSARRRRILAWYGTARVLAKGRIITLGGRRHGQKREDTKLPIRSGSKQLNYNDNIYGSMNLGRYRWISVFTHVF